MRRASMFGRVNDVSAQEAVYLVKNARTAFALEDSGVELIVGCGLGGHGATPRR
jgi:hypothetical protein